MLQGDYLHLLDWTARKLADGKLGVTSAGQYCGSHDGFFMAQLRKDLTAGSAEGRREKMRNTILSSSSIV